MNIRKDADWQGLHRCVMYRDGGLAHETLSIIQAG